MLILLSPSPPWRKKGIIPMSTLQRGVIEERLQRLSDSLFEACSTLKNTSPAGLPADVVAWLSAALNYCDLSLEALLEAQVLLREGPSCSTARSEALVGIVAKKVPNQAN